MNLLEYLKREELVAEVLGGGPGSGRHPEGGVKKRQLSPEGKAAETAETPAEHSAAADYHQGVASRLSAVDDKDFKTVAKPSVDAHNDAADAHQEAADKKTPASSDAAQLASRNAHDQDAATRAHNFKVMALFDKAYAHQVEKHGQSEAAYTFDPKRTRPQMEYTDRV